MSLYMDGEGEKTALLATKRRVSTCQVLSILAGMYYVHEDGSLLDVTQSLPLTKRINVVWASGLEQRAETAEC